MVFKESLKKKYYHSVGLRSLLKPKKMSNDIRVLSPISFLRNKVGLERYKWFKHGIFKGPGFSNIFLFPILKRGRITSEVEVQNANVSVSKKLNFIKPLKGKLPGRINENPEVKRSVSGRLLNPKVYTKSDPDKPAAEMQKSHIIRKLGVGSLLTENVKRYISRAIIPGSVLDKVRIYSGAESASVARKIGADAFTVGSDIHFAQNRFKPETSEGMGLLVHELTHVSQQQRLGTGLNFRNITNGRFQDMENEALQNESRFVHAPVGMKRTLANIPRSFQRQASVAQSGQKSAVAELSLNYSPIPGSQLSNTVPVIAQKAEESRSLGITAQAAGEGFTAGRTLLQQLDIQRIADEVYRIIERKIEIEKERSGGFK